MLGFARYRPDDTNKQKRSKTPYIVRYADHMVILVKSKFAADLALDATKEFLKVRGLEVSSAKTKVTDLTTNDSYFDFLGYRVQKRTRKGKTSVLIIPPQDKVKNVMTQIKDILSNERSIYHLFVRTNSVIRGWCYYYVTVNAKDCFKRLAWWLGGRFFWKRFSRVSLWKGFRNKRNPKKKMVYKYIMNKFKGRIFYGIPQHVGKTRPGEETLHLFLHYPEDSAKTSFKWFRTKQATPRGAK